MIDRGFLSFSVSFEDTRICTVYLDIFCMYVNKCCFDAIAAAAAAAAQVTKWFLTWKFRTSFSLIAGLSNYKRGHRESSGCRLLGRTAMIDTNEHWAWSKNSSMIRLIVLQQQQQQLFNHNLILSSWSKQENPLIFAAAADNNLPVNKVVYHFWPKRVAAAALSGFRGQRLQAGSLANGARPTMRLAISCC